MAERPKFYLTTPIYYVNARPHIGHAYTTIVADVLARRHRLLGDDTYFLTGTDEHGQKIERSALAAGVPPQQFADEVSETFRALWQRMGITNNDYIRTTEERHKAGVQKLFRTLEHRGHIYLSSYTGSYCVSDEAFVDLPVGAPCPDCGRPLETVTEENYFFKLSAFQRPLLDLIESGTLSIQPESRKNEVLSFLRGNIRQIVDEFMPDCEPEPSSYDYDAPVGDGPPPMFAPVSQRAADLLHAEQAAIEAGKLALSEAKNPYVPGALKDLSISRSSFTWGIPVPGNDKHVIYVWLDALANYMTALGYGSDLPEDEARFERYWPADVHLVGKEIIRFHCVYWPAFLMAAGLPLPKAVVAHGWLLFDESKMSKSKGNIVRTETILDAFGGLCPAPVESVPQRLKPDVVGSVDGTAEAVPLSKAGEVAGPSQRERDLFAADVLRYFLLREIPFGQDGSFSFDALVTRYNADLANGYGNLVSRTLNLIQQNQDGVIARVEPPWLFESRKSFIRTGEVQGIEEAYSGTATVVRAVHSLSADAREHLDNFRFESFLSRISLAISIVDRYLTANAPWALAKSADPVDREKLNEALYVAAESIRVITSFLYCILPYSTSKVWHQLGLGSLEEAAQNGKLRDTLAWGNLQTGTKLGPLGPIFPRADKGLVQTMTDVEFQSAPKSLNEARPGDGPAPEAVAVVAAEPVVEKAPEITIDDFVKVELRVAQIVVAERIPKADKLLRLEVDLGYERRQILSGIAEWYTPEELVGRRIVVITNLAPRKMRGLESHGMLLAASEGEHGKPALATCGDEIGLGARLK